MILLSSFFFAYAGLSIVISFAFIYGDQIVKWSGTTQIMMFVITQFTAAVGAFLFGIIQDRWKAKQTFILTLLIWVISHADLRVSAVTGFVNPDGHVFEGGACVSCGRIDCRTGSWFPVCLSCHGRLFSDTKSGEFRPVEFHQPSFSHFRINGPGAAAALFGLGGSACLYGIVSDGHGLFLCR